MGSIVSIVDDCTRNFASMLMSFLLLKFECANDPNFIRSDGEFAGKILKEVIEVVVKFDIVNVF